jgi:hypothetical protein
MRESVIVAVANLVALRQSGFASSAPVPSDSPMIVSEGPDPDRILLAGAGVVTGYGLASHALGIGGHLARCLTAETERGVRLDIVPLASLLFRFAPLHLARLDLGCYTAVILAVGVNDAFGMTSRNSWKRSLAATLRLFQERMLPGSQVFLIAIADPSSSALFRSGPAGRARSRALALNQETKWAVASEPNVTTIELQIGDASDVARMYDSSSYRRWARQLSPRVVEGLTRMRSTR